MKANSLIALLLVPGLVGDPVTIMGSVGAGPRACPQSQSLFTAQALALGAVDSTNSSIGQEARLQTIHRTPWARRGYAV